MSRILAVLFILMANFVLFVHAVIPHHHHENNLCFDTVQTSQPATDECCNETCTAENHQHDTDKESDSCVLSHIVALFNGDIKQNIRVSVTSLQLINHISLLTLTTDEFSLVSNPRYFIEFVFNDHIPVYHSLVSKIFGLRAPPSYC